MTESRNQVDSHFLTRLSWSFSSLAAGLGCIALVGWIASLHWLSSFWPGGIPMAPSTALLFLVFGLVLPLRTRISKISRHSRLSGLLVWGGTGVSATLLVLSLRGIYLPVEFLGMDISGTMNGAPIGHMSPMTALIFTIAGCSLLSLSPAHGQGTLLSFWLAVSIVLVSMILLVGYLVDAPLFYATPIIPPAMSTSLAFFLLGIALLLSAGVNAWPPPTLHDDSRDGLGIVLLLAFIFLAIGILAAGYLYSQNQQRQFRSWIETQLGTIADLKNRELNQWRQERRADASLFFKNAAFSRTVQKFLNEPDDPETKRHLETWLDKIEQLPQCDRISLFNTAGVVQLFSPNPSGESFPFKKQDIHDAVERRQVTFLDFARKSPDLPPHLATVVPILSAPDWGEVIAVLAMEIDPEYYLYPLIREWPVPSNTAETLLVRREGDDVLFLNDLKFMKNAALNLRFPLTQSDLPAAMAVRGGVGIVEGFDYRHKKVIAAVRPVPDSPWFMVARMDLDEISQPLRQRLLAMTGLLCALLLGSGALAGLVWRNQRAQFYRLRYEAALAAEDSERRLRIVFESSKDGILVADKEKKTFVIANAAICRMLGYTHDELLTMEMSDIHPAADFPVVAEQFERLARGEASLAADIPMLCRDGSVFYADIKTSPLQLGGRTCILGSFRDITDRMLAEARIRHLNRVLRAIRDVNQLIVKATSVDELIENACTVLADRRSYASALIVLTDDCNLPIAHAEAGEDIDFRPLVEQIEQGILPLCCAAVMNREDGCLVNEKGVFCEPCPMSSLCASALRMSIRLEHQETVYGCLAVSVDMGIAMDEEEKKLFAELAGDLAYSLHNMAVKRDVRRAEEENKKLEAQFIQAQKMEAVGQLAGGVAHDFNNLLSIIIGYTTILKEEMPADESSEEAIGEIYDAAIRATNLTRQLLAFSRKQTLEMQVVDVNEVIRSFEKLLRRTIGEDIAMRLALNPEPVLVKADVSQLEQVLLNLAVNARDAMPDGGQLVIETAHVHLDEAYVSAQPGARPGLHAMITISDSGSGMDATTQARIFEPFFTTKALDKGTGLGLATVYGVVKQHGGNIRVSSEPGQGTTFTVYLPSVEETLLPQDKHMARHIASAQAETVLVVEDEPSLRRLACQVLARHGYTVLESSDVHDAIAIAGRHPQPIHLLLTDVIMPTMKGNEVYDKVAEFHPQIRVLYMSGYSDNVIAHHGVLKEGVHFLQKPFSAESLLEKVHNTLRAG